MNGNADVQPLSGIRVLDFTQVMLGPSATQLLSDHGAEVIKVERPGAGDLSRSAMGEAAGLDNPVFASLNRNKRSITVDLRSPEGGRIIRDLVANCDVLVHNFRPGAMERRGLGYEECRAINPRLIYAVGSGFGPTGPYQHKGGQDALAQALTGVMERRADQSIPLSVYATTFADYSAGMHLVQGVLLALRARDLTGEGQRVDASLFNALLSMQMQEATAHLMTGQILNWAAYPLSGVFHATDGAFVLIGAFKQNPLRDICVALGIEDLSQEERYATFDGQMAHREELQAVFTREFAKNRVEYWLERLEDQDLLCAKVQSLGEALEDPQTKHNGMVVDIPRGDEAPVRTIASPITLSSTPMREPSPPPKLGQHTAEVLTDVLGMDQADIDRLAAEGVLG
ncbi:CaiB/BaiF CoA transferase family protein [Egicoccus sp. AB-alg2]|uniref:CaiB/BaiF CoA transferase family protein n=1 Tax=Egicoccus sp. AB-alg2 TaxID=3242693 RepID=UPI00359D3F01